jgi:hypothetical protein
MTNDGAAVQSDRPVADNERILLPGDILLVTSPRKVMPRINCLLQAVVRLTLRSSFSHVALSLGGDLIAESLTEDGVRIKSLQKFLQNIDVASGLVLRPKDRTRLDDVFRGARYYYGARYNWKFMLSKPAGREAFYLFCSEFVSRVFQGLGYREFGRRAAEKTLPVDLARLSFEPGWTTFKLADLLEPEPEPLPDLSSLEQDPTLAAIIERAKQRAADMPRQRQLAEQQLDGIVKANDSEFILTQAANAFLPPALAYYRALLEDLNACRDTDEQIELLTRRTGKDPWSHLPRIASFIARPLDPSAPAVICLGKPGRPGHVPGSSAAAQHADRKHGAQAADRFRDELAAAPPLGPVLRRPRPCNRAQELGQFHRRDPRKRRTHIRRNRQHSGKIGVSPERESRPSGR